MRFVQPVSLGLVLSAAAACGGASGLSPGVGDDPGTGSLTLLIDADVSARPLVPNAREDNQFTTEFHVRVEKNGGNVTAGSVTVRSSGGDVPLIYGGDSGRWNGAQVGYFQVYELEVVAGEDFVEGVRVDGPALHYFSAPLAGATVDSLMPLAIEWKRDEAADTATIETQKVENINIADTGTFSLPAGSLKSKSDATEEERLRLDRSQRVTPTGAIVGSSMRVEIRNEIDLLVQPTGL